MSGQQFWLDRSFVDEVVLSLAARDNLPGTQKRLLEELGSLPDESTRTRAEVLFLLALTSELLFDRPKFLEFVSDAVDILFPGQLRAEEERRRIRAKLSVLDTYFPFPQVSGGEPSPPAAKTKAVYLVAWYWRALRSDSDIALRKLNDVISLFPGFPLAYYERGMVRFSLGKFRKAKRDAKMALQFAETFDPARTLLASSRHMLKRAELAEEFPTVSKEERLRLEELEEQERLARKIDFTSPRISASLSDPIDWEGVKRVNTTDSGSSGVFFLEMRDDTILVVKGSSFIAEEIFCSEVARRLPEPIVIPKIVLLEKRRPPMKSNDWIRCKELVDLFSENDNAVLGNYERNLRDRPFFLAMEFVSGHGLGEDEGAIARCTLDMLRQIGRVYVYDLIVNNYDRFPVPNLFDHEGNSENVMILRGSDVVVAIDTCINPLRNADAIEAYCACVQAIALMHSRQRWEGNLYIDRLARFLGDFLRRELEPSDKEALWSGMDEIYRHLDLVLECVADVKASVAGMMKGEDWNNVFSDSIDRIDVDLITKVIHAMKRGYDSE